MVQNLYQYHDFWVIFAAGFTPIPYKIFTIAAESLRLTLRVLFSRRLSDGGEVHPCHRVALSFRRAGAFIY